MPEMVQTTVTGAMSARLNRISYETKKWALGRVADRMRSCMRFDGRRCGQASCPRCSAHRSKRYKRRLEEKFGELPKNVPLVLITVTLYAPQVRGGLMLLGKSITKLRRRAAWSPVVGGEQFVQIEATARRGWFNAHAHMVCELTAPHALDVGALRRAWAEIVGVHGLSGSLDCGAVYGRWAR